MDLRLGQKIILEAFADADSRYESRIADIGKEEFFVEPLYDPAQRTFRMHVLTGTKFLAFVIGANGSAYRFSTQVLGMRRDRIWLVSLRLPRRKEFERVQRRGYLRVPVHIDLRIQRRGGEEFATTSRDISAGGISFLLPPEVVLLPGEQLTIAFSLPLLKGGRRDFQLTGELVRVFFDPEHSSHLVAAVRFLDLSSEEERFLVRYSFERQWELREKGILE